MHYHKSLSTNFLNEFMAFRCIFRGNSFRLPQQCSVFIAAGVCRIEDCQITSQSGGGMLHVLSICRHDFCLGMLPAT